MIAHGFRTEILVRRKTEELELAHKSQTQLLQRAKSASERLDSLQKMGAIGQMSSIISHELRQPLATIQMYTRGGLRVIEGLENTKENSKIVSAFSLIDKQCVKMESIIEKVRSYAKQKKTKHELIDAAEIAKIAVENFETSKNGSVKVKTEFQTGSFVWADSLELELVIVNLLRNASEAQGNVSEPIRISVTWADNKVEISISDKGRNLSEEEFEKLKVPLTSTKENGMGLGLTIVKTIVEAHQGKIC